MTRATSYLQQRDDALAEAKGLRDLLRRFMRQALSDAYRGSGAVGLIGLENALRTGTYDQQALWIRLRDARRLGVFLSPADRKRWQKMQESAKHTALVNTMKAVVRRKR